MQTQEIESWIKQEAERRSASYYDNVEDSFIKTAHTAGFGRGATFVTNLLLPEIKLRDQENVKLREDRNIAYTIIDNREGQRQTLQSEVDRLKEENEKLRWDNADKKRDILIEELKDILELDCHGEYIKDNVADRIKRLENPNQLP